MQASKRHRNPRGALPAALGTGLGLAAALAGCAKNAPVEQSLHPTEPQVSYSLGSNVQHLYPDRSWLPEPYKSRYRDITGTIAHFTMQSLQRDGIQFSSVTALETGVVTITSADPQAQLYQAVHAALFDEQHGQQAQNGALLCQNTTGCWNKGNPDGRNEPWAFFLPLGLPMVNQKAVTFLDYPPLSSLLGGDYLANPVVDRWTRVLAGAGVPFPVLYQTIVDARPIAAPGSNQSAALPDAATFFNAAGTNHAYLTPTLTLLTNPPNNPSVSNSRPVAVLGATARGAWAKITGQTVNVLSVGNATLPTSTKATSWVAGNSPDVTAAQCCSGDKNAACYDAPSKGYLWSLIPDEQVDLQVACIIQMLADNQGMPPEAAKTHCYDVWGLEPGKLVAAQRHTLCILAKLDNANPAARCAGESEAEKYCTAYADNPCASLTCQLP